MRPLESLTPGQVSLLRRLPDLPGDGKMLRGAALRVARGLRDRGFTVCTGSNGHRDWYARTAAGEAALHLPENQRWIPRGI